MRLRVPSPLQLASFFHAAFILSSRYKTSYDHNLIYKMLSVIHVYQSIKIYIAPIKDPYSEALGQCLSLYDDPISHSSFIHCNISLLLQPQLLLLSSRHCTESMPLIDT